MPYIKGCPVLLLEINLSAEFRAVTHLSLFLNQPQNLDYLVQELGVWFNLSSAEISPGARLPILYL